MTVEELLKPRRKVISDYPDSPYSVGDIITFSQWGGDLNKWANYDDEGQFVGFTDHFDEFPHIFKILQWWEDRKSEDMPEYIKLLNGECYKVEKWEYSPFFRVWYDDNKKKNWSNSMHPITKQEYESYINKQQP